MKYFFTSLNEKIISFLNDGQNIAQILIWCFAKLWNFFTQILISYFAKFHEIRGKFHKTRNLNFVIYSKHTVGDFSLSLQAVLFVDPEWFIPDLDPALNFPSSQSGSRPKFWIHADPDPDPTYINLVYFEIIQKEES